MKHSQQQKQYRLPSSVCCICAAAAQIGGASIVLENTQRHHHHRSETRLTQSRLASLPSRTRQFGTTVKLFSTTLTTTMTKRVSYCHLFKFIAI